MFEYIYVYCRLGVTVLHGSVDRRGQKCCHELNAVASRMTAKLAKSYHDPELWKICLVVLRSSARRDLPRPPPPPPRDLELLKIPKRAVTPFAVPEASAEGAAAESLLERLTSRASIVFFGAMRHLGTGDVMTVAACCSKLSAALDGGDAIEVNPCVLPSAGFARVRQQVTPYWKYLISVLDHQVRTFKGATAPSAPIVSTTRFC